MYHKSFKEEVCYCHQGYHTKNDEKIATSLLKFSNVIILRYFFSLFTVLLFYKGFSCIFSCKLHYLSNSSRMVFKVPSNIVDLLVQNYPTTFFRFMQRNFIFTYFFSSDNQFLLFFLLYFCFDLSYFLEISLWRRRGFNFSNQSCVSETDRKLRMRKTLKP